MIKIISKILSNKKYDKDLFNKIITHFISKNKKQKEFKLIKRFDQYKKNKTNIRSYEMVILKYKFQFFK